MRYLKIAILAFTLILNFPVELAAQEIVLEGQHLGSSDDLKVFLDSRPPDIVITSPVDLSTVGTGLVTVTGTAVDPIFDQSPADDGFLFGTLLYRVRDENFVTIGEGSAPIVNRQFSIQDIPLGTGDFLIEVRATDAAGLVGFRTVRVTSDPSAPAVVAVRPRDGQNVDVATANVDLNFSAISTTLVSVNGVADGRVFGQGIAPAAISVPLEFGPNTISLEVESGGTQFTSSFTLFRLSEPAAPKILSPSDRTALNTQTVVVTGTVPLGTPLVEVNGVPATLGPDLVSFSVEIPTPQPAPDRLLAPIRAVSFPFNLDDSVEVRPDFVPPNVFDLEPPGDGFSTSSVLPVFGRVNEKATITIEGGSTGPVSVRTTGGFFVGDGFLIGITPDAFPRFEADVDLAPGLNGLTLRAVDDAGNETVIPLDITQTDAALGFLSPTPGIPVPALRTDVTLQALQSVIIDAWFAAGRRVPAHSSQTVPVGNIVFSDVPLLPGLNEMRVVYRRTPTAPPEVLTFEIESSATGTARLAGTVTDEDTGAGLGGAFVTVTASGITLIAVTNGDGSFDVEVEAGSIGGVVTATGYSTGNFSTTLNPGDTFNQDLALMDTGLPALANELDILVPPDGTVTDHEEVTVVGTVLNPGATVTVNGVPATVAGNRFTAIGVPLSAGPNVIAAAAVVPGSPVVTTSVSVEQAAEPVLAVTLFSPPNGATAPGSGLVVRGFVSARFARTRVGDRIAAPVGGVFTEYEAIVPAGDLQIRADSETNDGAQGASDSVTVNVLSSTPALTLEPDLSAGSAPLDSNLSLFFGGDSFSIQRLDFDRDGDGTFEVTGSLSSTVPALYTDSGPHYPRVLATTPEGLELSASSLVFVFLPSVAGQVFAAGNPVDLAAAPGGGVYVLDKSASLVREYSDNLTLIQTLGSGVLAAPGAMTVAADQSIYVANDGAASVTRLFSDGTNESIDLGVLDDPCGIEVADGHIFIAECGASQVRIAEVDDLQHQHLIGISGPGGIKDLGGEGIAFTSAESGILSTVDNENFSPADFLESAQFQSASSAPVDIELSGDGLAIADVAEQSIVLFTDNFDFERTIDLPTAPKAVTFGQRRDVKTLLVADGTVVREIELPVPSPLATFEQFRGHLENIEIEEALSMMVAPSRPTFERILNAIAAELPVEAQAMSDVSVEFLREEVAQLIIRRLDSDGVTRSYPLLMSRSEDGRWLIVDF